MCIKRVQLINHDCRLPIIVLLYTMLYIGLAYSMLLAALSNAVCLYNACCFAIDFSNVFCFLALSSVIVT